MPLDEPAKSRPSDPGLNLLDGALHDGALILEAYTRFTTTLIGTVLFPYAALPRPQEAKATDFAEPSPRPSHRGMAQVFLALIIGIVLGRRLFAQRS